MLYCSFWKKFLGFWFFSILLINTPLAQTLERMEISEASAPLQGVAVFMDYPDKAAIIIESPIPTLRFSSNMNGIVQEMHEAERGRYVLILEPFTQILVIDSPGYIQQRQRIGNPQPRDVRYFEVEPEERTSDLVSVIFNVEPADARLFVNGQETPVNQTAQLTPGSAEVRLEREGYRTVTDAIEVSEQNIQFNYQLEEIDIVPVSIQSNVEGATVAIDGTVRGQIDGGGGLGLFLYPGSYALSVSQTGYITQNRTLDVSEEGRNEVRIELERNVGELVLQVEPSNARVSLNRQDYSGQSIIELAPGRYRLDIELRGYEPYSETIEIILNERTDREISLQPYVGSLQFSVTPSNAQVQLINRSGEVVNEWSGIQILRNVQAGAYTLKVTAEGHVPKERPVEIKRDQTVQVSLELEEGSLFGTEIVDVTNPATEKTWMDRNLGASRAATSSTDSLAYGDFYQWGRAADGHENRNSNMTDILSSSNQPGHGEFIIAPNSPHDWRSPQYDNLWQGSNGINNPCPDGYRLPTEAEWEAERQSWSRNSATGAFSSPLKLPIAGYRSWRDGRLGDVGLEGGYWSSSVYGAIARGLGFDISSAVVGSGNLAGGYSVRCIKD